MVKRTFCTYRLSGSNSQNAHDGSKQSIALIPGDLIHFSGLSGIRHTGGVHTCTEIKHSFT